MSEWAVILAASAVICNEPGDAICGGDPAGSSEARVTLILIRNSPSLELEKVGRKKRNPLARTLATPTFPITWTAKPPRRN